MCSTARPTLRLWLACARSAPPSACCSPAAPLPKGLHPHCEIWHLPHCTVLLAAWSISGHPDLQGWRSCSFWRGCLHLMPFQMRNAALMAGMLAMRAYINAAMRSYSCRVRSQ